MRRGRDSSRDQKKIAGGETEQGLRQERKKTIFDYVGIRGGLGILLFLNTIGCERFPVKLPKRAGFR